MFYRWRAVIILVAALAAPPAVEAQTGRTYRVACVELARETAEHKPFHRAFRTAMRDLGYVEGNNLTFDLRFADNDVGRLRALVDEVIALKTDVLLGFEPVAQVMRTKTTSIPIVLTGALDPIRAGLAQSLARPGLNVTGSTQLMDQLSAEHIEILREIRPRLARVGQLVDTTSPGCRVIEEQVRQAARSVGVVFRSLLRYEPRRDRAGLLADGDRPAQRAAAVPLSRAVHADQGVRTWLYLGMSTFKCSFG